MGKKNTSKAVALKSKNELAEPSMFDSGLQSSGDTMDKVDLRISKLTLIQGMTKASFNTSKAPVGSFIDSVEKTNFGEKIELFVMNDTKLWEIKYLAKGDKVDSYLGTIDYNPANANLRDKPRIPTELAKKAKEKSVSVDMLSQINMINRFYVLRVIEVVEGKAFPYIVDFKRASYPAGVQLKNNFFKMKSVQNIPSYARVFELSSEFIQDKHDYYIKKVSAGRNILTEEIKAVEKWVKEMMQNKDAYQDDNSDDGGEAFVNAEATVVNEDNGKPKF